MAPAVLSTSIWEVKILLIKGHPEEAFEIDMVLKFPDYIYVIELKLDSSAKEALNQIDSNHYTVPFTYDGRKIIKVGINFSSNTRNITEVLTSPI